MAAAPNRGIWQYWQPLVGMASFLIGVGIFYAKSEAQGEKMRNLEALLDANKKQAEARADRQLEIIQSQDKRIIELEKRTEYYKGLRDGRNEVNNKKSE